MGARRHAGILTVIRIPDLGEFDRGLVPLEATSDDLFRAGRNGVGTVAATADRKVEFVAFEDRSLAHVTSALGYPAYYPVQPVRVEPPIEAVLMDLDGTSVRSEHFWVWIIEQTTASLLGNPRFALDASDLPFVSGHSVSEHLHYCISKYCPGASLAEARRWYFEHTHREMRAILDGRGRADAFVPSPGLREFLLVCKDRGIRLGLVTSGLHEKAYPEIVAAFRTMGLGDPAAFYDAIITAGYALRAGEVGTLGELSPKPHPWLYAEVFRIGLGLSPERRAHVLGLEDSAAGICAVRLAGLAPVGVSGGNIRQSGLEPLCHRYCADLDEVARTIF